MEDLIMVDLCPELKGEELPSCEADVGCSELPRERNGLARGGIVSLGVRVFAKILTIKHRLSQLLCDSRRMNAHVFKLLLQGSPTEVCVKDCSWLTEEEFTKCLQNFDPSNLMPLHLDLPTSPSAPFSPPRVLTP
ncbi:uncharacterized protein LOC21409630 isoform X1 [Morus notabilis]|uniref:uncharacterized protein LOC21409630 isoform X1 n=1 Tax=Morus notabilis TaxID=981085 RepID=UPI000CED3643|nr:uncharacterized protein LOC21409630 isoform X1 [Morus notabilis]